MSKVPRKPTDSCSHPVGPDSGGSDHLSSPQNGKGRAFVGAIGIVVISSLFGAELNDACDSRAVCANTATSVSTLVGLADSGQKVASSAEFSPMVPDPKKGSQKVKNIFTYVIDSNLPLLKGPEGLGVGVRLAIDEGRYKQAFGEADFNTKKELGQLPDAPSYTEFLAVSPNPVFNLACVNGLRAVVIKFKDNPSSQLEGSSVLASDLEQAENLYTVGPHSPLPLSNNIEPVAATQPAVDPTAQIPNNPNRMDIYAYGRSRLVASDPTTTVNLMLGCKK